MVMECFCGAPMRFGKGLFWCCTNPQCGFYVAGLCRMSIIEKGKVFWCTENAGPDGYCPDHSALVASKS